MNAKKIVERYVTGIPRKPLPEGIVLVHNHVVPQKLLGMNGFRAWIQPLDDTLARCPCDWAGVDLHGLAHYRVKRKVTKFPCYGRLHGRPCPGDCQGKGYRFGQECPGPMVKIRSAALAREAARRKGEP